MITIKDLPESVDLDRKAMAAITGGARIRAPQSILASTMSRRTLIANYPTTPLSASQMRAAGK
ncbi:MAG TPA: hypothetical protein VM532_17275 [Burkholderiales bacterium]|jgi:hypothetical protein|nr:hypothetical protein [Burkholderiales bacterium]